MWSGLERTNSLYEIHAMPRQSNRAGHPQRLVAGFDGGHDGAEPSIKASHLTADGVQPDCFASSVQGMNFVEAVSAFKPDHMNRPGNSMDEAVRISQSG